MCLPHGAVRDDHDRFPLPVAHMEQVQDDVPVLRVHGPGRFVRQDDAARLDPVPRDGDALLRPAAQAEDLLLLITGKAGRRSARTGGVTAARASRRPGAAEARPGGTQGAVARRFPPAPFGAPARRPLDKSPKQSI